jgi:hypothetical protein
MNSTNKTTLQALGYSLAGAAAAALANETAKRVGPSHSPIGSLVKRGHLRNPFGRHSQLKAIAGGLLSTPLLTNILGAKQPKRSWLRSALVGLGAGLGSLALPHQRGGILRKRPMSRGSRLGNLGRVLMGSLAVAATSRILNQSLRKRHTHPQYD